MDEKLTHDEEHDSRVEPVQGCPYCQNEVRRRLKRCYGDGYGSVPAKTVEES